MVITFQCLVDTGSHTIWFSRTLSWTILTTNQISLKAMDSSNGFLWESRGSTFLISCSAGDWIKSCECAKLHPQHLVFWNGGGVSLCSSRLAGLPPALSCLCRSDAGVPGVPHLTRCIFTWAQFTMTFDLPWDSLFYTDIWRYSCHYGFILWSLDEQREYSVNSIFIILLRFVL